MSSTTKFFTPTHYGVSTVAAVAYAIAWLIGSQVRAEAPSSYALPAIVVTAQREAQGLATLDPIVVTARRDAKTSYIVLAPVVVTASRDVLTVDARQITSPASRVNGEATVPTTLFTKLRAWVRTRTHVRA